MALFNVMLRARYFMLISGLVVSVALLIFVVWFFISEYNVDLSSKTLEECNSVKQGSEGAINIVFFADNKRDVDKYVDYFLSIAPFNKYKEKFNFFYIGSYKPECELYKDVALLCYSRELLRKAGSCPNDFVVVINDEQGEHIRSSSYLNVMSINAKHPLTVFTHEFGHAFVNLAEEYVPAKIPRGSAGNCVEDCKTFNGRNDGCFEGCSLAEYKRSVENGIMRSLRSDDYGGFNKWVIENKISEYKGSGITGRAISEERNCNEELYYLTEVKYSLDKGWQIKPEVEKGCVGGNGNVGSFASKIVLDDGSKIDVGRFNPEYLFTHAPDKDNPDAIDAVIYSLYDEGDPLYTDAPKIHGKAVEDGGDIQGEVYSDVRNELPPSYNKAPKSEWRFYLSPGGEEIKNPQPVTIEIVKVEEKKIEPEEVVGEEGAQPKVIEEEVRVASAVLPAYIDPSLEFPSPSESLSSSPSESPSPSPSPSAPESPSISPSPTASSSATPSISFSSDTCTDSDGGINYNVRGGHVEMGGDDIAYDYCTNNILTEFFCNTDGSSGIIEHTCQNGCVKGACISPTKKSSASPSQSGSPISYTNSYPPFFRWLGRTITGFFSKFFD